MKPTRAGRLRRAHLHHAAVHGGGRARAQIAVDRLDHALGGAEVGVLELEVHEAAFRLEGRHGALDDGAVGDAAHGELVDLHLAAVGRRARAAHQHVALRHGVHLPVAPLSGVISSVPPRRLLALPIDDTTTSS
jgi:hypothetical protein